jgi:hypothetical protein
LSELAFSLSKT